METGILIFIIAMAILVALCLAWTCYASIYMRNKFFPGQSEA